jgi:hypothetical protein
MKRVGIVCILLLMLLSAFGEKVPKQRAQEVALQFLSIKDTKNQRVVNEIQEELKADVVTYYVVNYEPEGWAIVAADDRVQPILAYSVTGKFNNDKSIISPETEYWVNIYKEQIYSVIKENSLPKNKEWDRLLEENKLPTKSATASVSPLLSVTWNQNAGWNRFCPEDEEGPGGHAYVGCVAVAMAQAMTVVKYPAQPQGKNSYVHDKYGTIYLNYDDEEPYNWNEMPANAANDENARLLYHCAVAVNMDFGPDGSGSLSSRVANALKKYFGYTNDIRYYKRFSSDTEWSELLKYELDKGNVLIYSGDPGTGDPGHSFNIDGYDINDYFHFNWGWSGKYNGYYTIDNINPGNDKFNQNQDVVTGISEPYFGPTDIILSNRQVSEELPVGSFVATVEVEDNSPVDFFTYQLDGGPKFPTGTHEASFYIENDTLKTKYVFDASVKDEYILNIKVTDMDMNSFRKEFLIKILPKSFSTNTEIQTDNKVPNIFYSTANHAITVLSENDRYLNATVDVFDSRGVKHYSGLIDSNRYLINTVSFNNGVYIVRVFNNDGRQQPCIKKLFVGNGL